MLVRNVIRFSFFLILVFTVLGSFFLERNFSTNLLEVLFLLLALTSIKSIPRRYVLFFLIASLYVFYAALMSIFNEDNYIDFLIVFKGFYYIAVLSLVNKNDLFSPKDVHNVLLFFVVIVLIKYIFDKFIYGVYRPQLLTENNIEFMVVAILYAYNSMFYNKSKRIDVIVLIIMVLSGSKSALLTYIVIFYILNVKSFKNGIVFPFVVILLFSINLLLFENDSMTNGISNIDRFSFLMTFINELESGTILDFILGKSPITPLSSNGCNDFYFYEFLFSRKEDNSCYSIVFHSFIMRVIFDHGLLGLLFFIVFYYALFCKYSRKFALCVISTMIINGLSVSSAYSIYFCMPILFILLTSNQAQLVLKKVNKYD